MPDGETMPRWFSSRLLRARRSPRCGARTLAEKPLESGFEFLLAREAHLPATGPDAAGLLGPTRLRHSPAVRHGGGRGNIAHGDLSALPRPRAVARRVRATVAPAEGRPLWREPEPPAALLPVPGRAQALAPRDPRSLPRIARSGGLRPREERCALRRGRLGKPDPRRLGARVGSVDERHGDHAVHAFL